MKRIIRFHLPIFAIAALGWLAPAVLSAQQALTWDQVKEKFEAANPALKADALGVDEMKAAEITAFLRPNPAASFTMDQLYPFGAHYDPNVSGTRNRPLSNALTTGSISYLWEREHKRELRLQSAKEGTQIAGSEHEDLERNLLFNLRSAFVADAPGQSGSGTGQGRPGLLRQHHQDQPRPLPRRRHCSDRSGPHRTAARPI